ncbi:hypothetical protein BCV69DRAFT_252341 [Microstroma glucosiphilum]|uniref:Uncharacterized protein n=1 Tax=Pseudomicrostroma glucosiphilum TaxID=1684307 RepID=A0A316U013_9BASI|nr:hypothetical protein BCV69DRAFT_252341 [Pseudomicrostroma glucosiphilum]PWN18570.1 hypothetical protein BCV69DRAFT_252341 [Pseudomicrostroma glucosiphilum]
MFNIFGSSASSSSTAAATFTSASGQTSASSSNLTTGPTEPQSKIRYYRDRGFYRRQNILDVVRESPLCHVAFQHGDTLMNIPLIVAVRPPTEDEEQADEVEMKEVVYLHMNYKSSLVEAVQAGTLQVLTASCTIVDGIVFSPFPHDHSYDYRSATLHLHRPSLVTDPAEKVKALAIVVNQSTGYDRSAAVGLSDPNGTNARGTAVIRCEVKAMSGKQRTGGFKSGESAEEDRAEADEGQAMQGAVPCWVQYGEPVGAGRDVARVREVYEEKSESNRQRAEGIVLADARYKLAGK